MTQTGNGEGEDLGPQPVFGGSKPFDLDLALELGRLCLQSYQMLIDFNKNVEFKLPAPFQLVKEFFTTEAYEGAGASGDKVPIAFIATQEDKIYVVFRGTVTIIEWIDDAEFGQESYTYVKDGGMTEDGFTAIYDTIHTDIVNTILDLAKTGNFSVLYITGHSLGAALAVLAVPELAAKTHFTQPIFYNFAGPRAGDPHFANLTYNSLGLTSWRVVNTNDLVPKLPQTVTVVDKDNHLKTFFYEHVNQAKDITFGKPISGPTDVSAIEEDHIMCNYYNALCKMTEDEKSCMAMADGADGCNAPNP